MARRESSEHGRVVQGLDLASGEWRFEPPERGEAFRRVPELDGVLYLDTASRWNVSRDAGHYLAWLPHAVLRPESVADVAAMVGFCRRHRVAVAARGLANTTHGQGAVLGLLIDMGGMTRVHPIESDLVRAEAGATWLDLTRAAVARGLIPPALTGYLALTLGGTLSLGGIPPALRGGAQVDSVRELEVVTGDGEVHRCSEHREPELFDAVLGGLGQFGIITEATIGLVSAKDTVRGHTFSYADAAAFFQDFRALAHRGDVTEIYGEWWRAGESGELHHLNAFTFYDRAVPPDDAALLDGLTAPMDAAEVSDTPFLAHVERIDDAVAELRVSIGWDLLAKPWFTVWLPETHVERYVTETVAELTPGDVGDGGFVLLYAQHRSGLRRPSLALPDADGGDWVYLFTIMTAMPAESEAGAVGAVLRRNRRLYERARAIGGRRYPVDSVDFDPADWHHHYGSRWPHLAALKRRLDPAAILTPGVNVFTE